MRSRRSKLLNLSLSGVVTVVSLLVFGQPELLGIAVANAAPVAPTAEAQRVQAFLDSRVHPRKMCATASTRNLAKQSTA